MMILLGENGQFRTVVRGRVVLYRGVTVGHPKDVVIHINRLLLEQHKSFKLISVIYIPFLARGCSFQPNKRNYSRQVYLLYLSLTSQLKFA